VNKTLIALIVTLSCLVGIGCKGNVTIDENSGTLQNDGMTIGTTSTTSQTASTTTESTTETITEPPIDPELIVTQQPIGDLESAMMEFDIFAPNYSVQVDSLPFMIASTDGVGFVKGTEGTNYFGLNQVIDVVNGALYAGPLEIEIVTNGGHSAELVFADSFVVAKGQTIKLAFTSNLSQVEDWPGQFLGRAFLISMHISEITGKVVELDEELTPGMVSPEIDPKQQLEVGD
jgi:hypothetical protein